jgi:hypothetical protein
MSIEQGGFEPYEMNEREFDEQKAEVLRTALDDLLKYHERVGQTLDPLKVRGENKILSRERYMKILKHLGEIEYIIKEEQYKRDPSVER